MNSHGHADAAFSPVRDAFEQNFADLNELGAAVCVRVGGHTVADIWGGYRDAARTLPWERDTLINVYSVGKGVLAALTLALIADEKLDLDRPASELWPEFAAEGKDRITLRTLLSHRAGLPAVRRPLPEDAMLDWDLMCRELASQRPYWDPDTAHGYHVNTLGYLVGELIRRSTGERVGAALRRWITGPLRADFHFGLPRSEHSRVAEMDTPDLLAMPPEQRIKAMPVTGDPEIDTMRRHVYFNPSGLSGFGSVNTEAWRLAEIPSTNGHATARAVAAVYDSLLHGKPGEAPFVPAELLADAVRPHSEGEDLVLGRESRFGLAFQLPQPNRKMGPNLGAFGHWGYGGSLGFADPKAGVAFAYLTNRPGERWKSPRTLSLIDAVYESLGAA